jgi:hypothetical protein
METSLLQERLENETGPIHGLWQIDVDKSASYKDLA